MKSRYHMRFVVVFLFICLCCPVAWAQEQDVEIGQTTNAVITALGEPKGLIESGTYQVLIYPRGEIVFRNGKVTSVALLSPLEAAAKQEMWRGREAAFRRKQAEKAARARAEAQRARAAAATSSPGPTTPAPSAAPASSVPWTSSAPGTPSASVEAEESEMTEEEKREAELKQLKAEVAAAEQAEKDLSNVAYSVKRRRELRTEVAELEKEYESMPVQTEEEQAARELAAAHIAALKAEIKDLGSKANRIRRRREVRERLAELQKKLAELEK